MTTREDLSGSVHRSPPSLRGRSMREKPTVILGGGPAGLTAGYLLAKQGLPVVVLEAEDQVGGIAKTAVRDGYRFDLGGHRFFTKAKEVDDLWHEIMREDFLERPRMSRIYWRSQRRREVPRLPAARPRRDEEARPGRPDQGAVLRTCGRRSSRRARRTTSSSGSRTASASWLFNQFFKSYTEKVWGVPDVGDPRRLGRPADQEPVVLQRRQVRLLRQQGRQGHSR